MDTRKSLSDTLAADLAPDMTNFKFSFSFFLAVEEDVLESRRGSFDEEGVEKDFGSLKEATWPWEQLK